MKDDLAVAAEIAWHRIASQFCIRSIVHRQPRETFLPETNISKMRYGANIISCSSGGH
jgi:hypothetical protein